MLDNGVKSTLLETGALADEVLANRAGSTVRVGIEALAAQLAQTGELAAIAAAATRTVVAATLAEAATRTPYPETQVLRVLGAAAAGDGGHADYHPVGSEPTHPGKLQLADGSWWAMQPYGGVCPRAFGTDDDQAFASLAAYVDAMLTAGLWRSGFAIVPSMIDGRGLTFTLTEDVAIEAGVHLHNVKLLMQSCKLTLGIDAPGNSDVRRFTLTSVHMEFDGAADYDDAILYIPKCSHTSIDHTCLIDGGRGTYRARYGAYLGRYFAFGFHVTAALRGGVCSIRIGRGEDQTSGVLAPLICDRALKYGAIVCNPKGVEIKGDFEHVEDGHTIAITSQSNGSADIAQAFHLSCGYSFNTGLENGGDSDGKTAILIGKELPDTFDWDGTGANITSGAFAQDFLVSDMYLVTDHVETFFDVACRGFANFERITWGGTPTGSNPQVFARFSGACQEVRLKAIRNQNTGAIRPVWHSTATNPILWSEGPNSNFLPTLYGETTAGSRTYTVRGCRYTTVDNIVTMHWWVDWSAESGGAGRAVLPLPPGITPISGGRAAAVVYSDGIAVGALTAIVFPGNDYITLRADNTQNDVTIADLPASGNLHLTLQLEVDFATVE